MIAALIPALAPILGKVVGNIFPDPEVKAKAEADMLQQLYAHKAEIESAAAQIINTEASSKHWLAANWRPLTMITFVGLIVAMVWLCCTRVDGSRISKAVVYRGIGLGRLCRWAFCRKNCTECPECMERQIMINAKSVNLIKAFEGFRAEPYQCSAGIWTIGYGSTYTPDDKKVTESTPAISEEEAHE